MIITSLGAGINYCVVFIICLNYSVVHEEVKEEADLALRALAEGSSLSFHSVSIYNLRVDDSDQAIIPLWVVSSTTISILKEKVLRILVEYIPET